MMDRRTFSSEPLSQILLAGTLLGAMLLAYAFLYETPEPQGNAVDTVLSRFEEYSGRKAVTTSQKPVELTAWVTYNDEQFRLYETLVEEWFEKTGVRVHISRIPFDGQRDKFLYACNSNTAPDIARMDIGLIPRFAVGKALLPMDELGDMKAMKRRLLPTALASGMVRTENGAMRLYALPDEFVNVALFYNKDLFREAGLNPETPPRTWAEFESMAAKLTRDTNQDGLPDQFGFAMTNTLWWSLPFLYSYNGDILDVPNLQCLLDEEESIRGLEYQIDLSRKGLEAGAWRPGSVQPDTGFKNKAYAMIFSGPWNLSSFRASGLNFGVALIPGRPELKIESTTSIGGNSNVIFKTTRHPQEAFEFLSWLTSAEVQGRLSRELGSIPVNLPEMEKLGFKPTDRELAVFIDQARHARSRPGIPRYGKIETIVNQEVEAAFQGSLSAQEAYRRACKAIDRDVLMELRPQTADRR